MATVLKIIIGDIFKDSRDRRELRTLRNQGHSIMVLNKGEKNEIIVLEDKYIIHTRKVRDPNASAVKKTMQRLWAIPSWALYARSLHPDLISCHDLSALFIGWMSTWFINKKNRPMLVYDAHEFEMGRNTKRSRLQKIVIRTAEKFLMQRCVFSMMVNDSIAEAVRGVHFLRMKPVVVRNITPKWIIDEKICEEKRRVFCEQLGMNLDNTLIMYWGAVTTGRGIEGLLNVILQLTGVGLIILGDGDKKYLEELRRQAESRGVTEKVLFKPAVSYESLWQYAGAVDISMITIPAICQSYYYMLPNKFFESIQSLTPVIASDFPEIRRVVREYDVGLLVNPESVEEIGCAVRKMQKDTALYMRFKNNLKKAKEELCWEREERTLIQAYQSVLRNSREVQ